MKYFLGIDKVCLYVFFFGMGSIDLKMVDDIDRVDFNCILNYEFVYCKSVV